MKNHLARKATVLRYIISMTIDALSFILAKSSGFRMFMGMIFIISFFVLLIFKLFWKGLDNGSFLNFYTESNLHKRDCIVHFSSILALYLTIDTVCIYSLEYGSERKLFCLIALAISTVFLTVESIRFFKDRNQE